MANFEGLIRGALSAKGATNAAERSVVYQSSRNALQRLIAENRSITVENAVAEQQALETAIAAIEAEYAPREVPPAEKPADDVQASDPFFEIQQVLAGESPPANSPSSQPTQVSPQPVPRQDPLPTAHVAAPAATQSVNAQSIPSAVAPEIEEVPQTAPPQMPPQAVDPEPSVESPVEAQQPAPEIQGASETFDGEPRYNEPYVDEPVVVPSGFKRRRKSQALLWIVFLIALLGVLAWIGYRLAIGLVDGSLLGYQTGGTPSVSRDVTRTDASSDYITILEPGDLTAMVVSDRGRVEIINEQSLEMIRILSVRDKTDRAQSAKPILIRLKPGVLEQIRGKRVTAEIYARSGSSSAAQFAVECEFGEGVGCGRKRFHVGVQPEASIFAFTMEQNRSTSQDAFIAINTDITDNADITGEGDILDIVYMRLRTSKE